MQYFRIFREPGGVTPRIGNRDPPAPSSFENLTWKGSVGVERIGYLLLSDHVTDANTTQTVLFGMKFEDIELPPELSRFKR